jgi:hypothetical protein
MDESFKLDLTDGKKAFRPMLEELESGTYNFKIVAAYPHTTKTNKKAFKFELLALDSDSPLYGKTVHKLNFLSHSIGKNILMRELKVVGVNVEAWADPISGVIEAAELDAQLATVGNEIHGKVVAALKTKRPNANGQDWHELQITGISNVEAPSGGEDELPF